MQFTDDLLSDAKFSGISPARKIPLQNFLALFQSEKCLCRIFQHFSG
jgi:hypothetical protein